MGFHGFSFGSLLLILVIAILLFGTKRLRHMGEDLGAAFKGFKKGLKDQEEAAPDQQELAQKKQDQDPHV